MIVYNKKFLASILLALISIAGAFAQSEEPPRPGNVAHGPLPPGAPIDDGIIILFAVALIYGVYITIKLSKKAAKA